MRHSFEELIGRELDRLYRAAIFLSGNRKDRAERLLKTAALGAFQEYEAREGTPGRADRWLDEHLARTFLRTELARKTHAGQPPRGPRRVDGVAEGDEAGTRFLTSNRTFELGALARAAAPLSPEHRVAFWLAVVERRSYGDVGEILRAPKEQVAGWIREGHRIIVRELSALESERRTQERKRHEL